MSVIPVWFPLSWDKVGVGRGLGGISPYLVQLLLYEQYDGGWVSSFLQNQLIFIGFFNVVVLGLGFPIQLGYVKIPTFVRLLVHDDYDFKGFSSFL